MTSRLFEIGISGLNAAQANLRTASHNISNAATPGFTRQEAVQSTALAQLTEAGFVGNGVKVDTVRRIYSEFLSNQVVASQSRSSELDTYYSQLTQIDNLLADPRAGLSAAMTSFFNAVQDVATNPQNYASRQDMLSGANSLVDRFRLIDGQLGALRRSVDDQITLTVTSINSYAKEIAALNEAIVLAKGYAGGRDEPNDLLDERDQLVLELNKLLRATVVEQDDGSFNVFIGNGQPLVAGYTTSDLVAMRDPYDASQLTVGFQTPGVTLPISESVLSGGSLGGLLAFRRDGLNTSQNQLGRIAIALGDSFNLQHRSEVISATTNTGNAVVAATYLDSNALTTSDYRLDYDGANYIVTRLSDNQQTSFAGLPANIDGVTLSLASGAPAAGDGFTIRPTRPGGNALSVIVALPEEIAAAAPIRTSQGAVNIGNGFISAGSVNAPPPPDVNLQQPVTITFTGAATFDVNGVGTGNPVGVAYTPGANITYNGWTVQIDGSPQAGDTFSVGPNTGGVADNRNALLLASLQTASIIGNGTATLESAYAAMVGDVGSRTRELEIASTAEGTLLQQHIQARDSYSGVNLDEEAANLVRYQQLYQASGKVIQIASEMFDTILQLGN
jgi:flagellar hook-associated protein 1 FlgK